MVKAYQTLLGRSTWALVNSYYAAVEDRSFYPDTVKIVAEAGRGGPIEAVKAALVTVSAGYGFKPSVETMVVSEGGFMEAGLAVGGELRRLREAGAETALDITSGRKPLVAGALLSAAKSQPDHLFYLMIDSTEDAEKPYLLIPRKKQTLIDFMDEARKGVRA